MNVYNGDVTVNPKLLELLINQITKLNDSISDLKNECDSIKSELISLRHSKESDKALEVLHNLPERDLRSVYEILFNSDKLGCVTHAANVLLRAGVSTVEDLKYLDMKSLKSIHMLGEKSLQMIKERAAEAGLSIPEKWVEIKPGIPEIYEGDTVITLVPQINDKLPVGSIVTVTEIYPVRSRYRKYYRILPEFVCKDPKTDKTFLCSISEIYKM